LLVIPAWIAGLRRQDAEANIRVANGPKGMPQERHVIQTAGMPLSGCRFKLLSHPFAFPRASRARVTFLCLPKEK